MGKILSLEERIANFNKLLEYKGSKVRAIKYTTLNEMATFECSSCGETFIERAINVKNKSHCRICEAKTTIKNTLIESIEESGEWKVVGSQSNKLFMVCKSCGKEYGYTFGQLKKGEYGCECTGKYIKSYTDKQLKEQSDRIYKYMVQDIEETGLLKGTELLDYIRDVIRIERGTMFDDEKYVKAVYEAVKNIYKKKKVIECKCCKRIFPPRMIMNNSCFGKVKKYCGVN